MKLLTALLAVWLLVGCQSKCGDRYESHWNCKHIRQTWVDPWDAATSTGPFVVTSTVWMGPSDYLIRWVHRGEPGALRVGTQAEATAAAKALVDSGIYPSSIMRVPKESK